MSIELLMGNQALGLGAMRAGVNFVSGYPGTPSTEVLETIASYNKNEIIHVEWSTNEKAALEAAIGASYAGARSLVTMKQVGLNVAADALMTNSYLGVKGGLVLVVADDPGPISSQTEQDTRSFGEFSKVPVLDPSDPQECYEMIQDAFELSERYETSVVVRPTTRVCHACATVETGCNASDYSEYVVKHVPSGFDRDTQKWVVFPKTSFEAHKKVERRALEIARDLQHNKRYVRIKLMSEESRQLQKARECCSTTDYELGIVCNGVSYLYVCEALHLLQNQLHIEIPILKVGLAYPFPQEQALNFMRVCKSVLVVEELDPYIERNLQRAYAHDCMQRVDYSIKKDFEHDMQDDKCATLCKSACCVIKGKTDGTFDYAGEQSTEKVLAVLKELLVCKYAPFHKELLAAGVASSHEKLSALGGASSHEELSASNDESLPEKLPTLDKVSLHEKLPVQDSMSSAALSCDDSKMPALPVRPPVLCAGCPHRASFYAVKKAVGKRKAVFCGDIGCYTLGNAAPLDMVDTCLCMGADITIAQGIKTIEPETVVFSFIGDSTFFASGITGVVNAVYNNHDIIVCVLDNSITAMTGQQPHPGTGLTMMGKQNEPLSIETILKAIGVGSVCTVNALSLQSCTEAVDKAIEESGVRAIIFKSPCINIVPSRSRPLNINQETCTNCRVCVQRLGCPALVIKDNRVKIDANLCNGCTLCAQVCPSNAIGVAQREVVASQQQAPCISQDDVAKQGDVSVQQVDASVQHANGFAQQKGGE